jgi:hypothetical protein
MHHISASAVTSLVWKQLMFVFCKIFRFLSCWIFWILPPTCTRERTHQQYYVDVHFTLVPELKPCPSFIVSFEESVIFMHRNKSNSVSQQRNLILINVNWKCSYIYGGTLRWLRCKIKRDVFNLHASTLFQYLSSFMLRIHKNNVGCMTGNIKNCCSIKKNETQ